MPTQSDAITTPVPVENGVLTRSEIDKALVPAEINTSPEARYRIRTFQAAPGIARNPGGRLWVTFYGDNVTTMEGPDNFCVLYTSDDDGVIYIVHDHQRFTEREVLMAAFTEEDVAEGACVSDKARLRVVVNRNPDEVEEREALWR